MTSPLLGSAYRGYLYSYPHKLSYREIEPSLDLEEAWRDERKEALFLYAHVPFCRIRCGFCNLFTTASGDQGMVKAWIRALAREAGAWSDALPGARFAQWALGGGTPTYLEPDELDQVFGILRGLAGSLDLLPGSVEVSPHTATPDRLALIAEAGTTRVSMGVQSLVPAEVRAAQRPQQPAEVIAAVEAIRAAKIPILNLDLIYGLPGQTPESWIASLRGVLEWEPEELFLYPLYVRPLTGMAMRQVEPGDQRLELYRIGRSLLQDAGYEAHSMRLFRKRDLDATPATYRCQEDGMVGLGVGARSYTRSLHHASRYAVGTQGVRSIIESYSADPHPERITWGIRLDEEEQRRRWLILSLLCRPGASIVEYRARFGADLLADYPQLQLLLDGGLALHRDQRLILTDQGMERSDAIGPWLISPQVRARMGEAELV